MAGIKKQRDIGIESPFDSVGHEGKVVGPSGNLKGSPTTAGAYAIIATGAPTGALMTVIPMTGGPGEAIKVKLSASPGTVNRGTKLVLDSSDASTLSADPGSGARVLVGEAWESGGPNELIGALLDTEEVFAT